MAEYPAQLRAEIEKYERKHEENPEGRNFVPLANAYRKAGELELAEGLLRDGIQRHTDYLSAHIVLGRVLADRGEAAEAAAEFRHVLSVDPQNLIALRTMGELAVGEGRADEAGYWYRELLVVDPMNDEARAALADLESEPAGADEFEGDVEWWQGERGPNAEPDEATATSGDPVGEGAPPVSEAESEAVTDPAASGFEEPGRVEEGTAVVPAEHHPIAPTHASLLGEADVTPDEEPREPVDGDLVESAAWDAPPAEYEIDAPTAESATSAAVTGDELVSETLAELYARQGFTDEATRMYRELIRRRGGEPHLLKRLTELEASASAVGDSAAGWTDEPVTESRPDTGAADYGWTAESGSPSPTPEPSFPGDEPDGDWAPDDPAPAAGYSASTDPFADSFRNGFGADDEADGRFAGTTDGSGGEHAPAPDDREAPSWLDEALNIGDGEEDERPGDGVSLGDYLRGLLAWRPGADAAGSAASASSTAPGATATADDQADDAHEADRAQGVSVGTSSADDEPFPWELPANEEPHSYDRAIEDAPDRSGEPDAQRGTSAAEPMEGDSATEQEGGHARADSASDLADDTRDSAPQADGDGGTLDQRREDRWGGSAPAAEDDDDLESFQAWLRSLKR